jgi:phage-related tail protein
VKNLDKETKQMFELILSKLDNIDKRQEGMEKRQDEMYLIQRSLEENTKVTRAEQDKMIYMLGDIQGKVTKLTEEVDEHEAVIKQIRSIK